MIYYAIVGLAVWYCLFKVMYKDKTIQEFWVEDRFYVVATAITYMAMWPLFLLGYAVSESDKDKDKE